MPELSNSRCLGNSGYIISLESSGAIKINNSLNPILEIEDPLVIPGWSKWKEKSIFMDIFSKNRTKWDISYSGDGIDFSDSDKNIKNNNFYIDNHSVKDGKNIFVLSKLIEFNFKKNNKYKIGISNRCFIVHNEAIKPKIAPYFIFLDKNGKEISREKKYCNIAIGKNWEREIFELVPPIEAKGIKIGIFLNSYYKVKVELDDAVLYEYELPNNISLGEKSWVKKRKSDEEKYFWTGSNADVRAEIYLSNLIKSSKIDLEYNFVFKKDTILDGIQIKNILFSQLEKILHRDLRWDNMRVKRTLIDRWTPKIFLSKDGLSISNANGIDSAEVQNNGKNSEILLNLVKIHDRPNFNFEKGGRKSHNLDQVFLRGECINSKFTIDLGKNRIPIFSSRVKGNNEAVFIMTHHADATTNQTFEAIMQGTSNTGDEHYGKRGIIGNGLTATWSVFSDSVVTINSDWKVIRSSEGSILNISIDKENKEIININTLKSKGDVHNLVQSKHYQIPVRKTEQEVSIKMDFDAKVNSDLSRMSLIIDAIDDNDEHTSRVKKEIKFDNETDKIEEFFVISRDAIKIRIMIFINKEVKCELKIKNISVKQGKREFLPAYINEGTKKSDYIAEGANSQRFLNSMKRAHEKGIELVLHTATHYADDRIAVEKAIQTMRTFGSKNWIDHSLASGIPSSGLKSKGWDKNSEYYVMDIFDKEGYEYAWSYIDDVFEGLNQLVPFIADKHCPILFQNQSLKSGKNPIWQWSTYRPPIKKLFNYVNAETIEKLVRERGISILHEYFAHATKQENYMFTKLNNGDVEISKQLEELFGIISEWVKNKLLWNPTVVEYGDYMRSLERIRIIQYDGTVIIDNYGEEVEDYCLWIGHDVNKFTIDFQDKNIEWSVNSNQEYAKYIFKLGIGKTKIKIVKK